MARATTTGKWLFAVVTPASALALGSVPLEALVVVSVLASVACGLLWAERNASCSRACHWVILVLFVLLGMTLLQCVPLPASIVRALAPSNADIWDRALSPLREDGPAWYPLSVAPPATHAQVLRGFFYGCMFLSAVRVGSLEHGNRFLVRLVVASSSLMALVTLLHWGFSAEKVFGLYTPREGWAYRPGRLAPLLNSNHLAAYTAFGACVAFGAFLSRRSLPRSLSVSMAAILVATSLMQASRGATGALAIGLLLTGGLTLYSKRRFHNASAEAAVVTICILAAVVVVAVATSETRDHLLSHDLSKLDAAKSSLRLVAGSPWFGVGRGAFETVFASVRDGSAYMTWTNPEDIVVQWLVEWGVPTALAGFGILLWAFRPQSVMNAVTPTIGAWAALAMTVLHDLVDYHLEVPGIVALVAVGAAIVLTVSRSGSSRASASASRLVRPAAATVTVGAVAAAAWVATGLGHTLAQDRRVLGSEATDRAVSAEQFREDVRAAMSRYPAEPFFPLAGAIRTQLFREGNVIPWVGRALERNPHFGRAHFVLARSLSVDNPSQARLEYRLAYQYDRFLQVAVLKEALPLIDNASSALELVPDGAAGIEPLQAFRDATAERLPSTTFALDQELERRAPSSPAVAARRATTAAADAFASEPWCADGRCMQDAVAKVDEWSRVQPDICGPKVLMARLRIARGDVDGALDALDAATSVVSDRGDCLRRLVDLSSENGRPRRVDAALDKLVKSNCGARDECIDLYTWAAATEEHRGRLLSAIRYERRILELTPERDDLLERIGELGAKAGLVSEALDAYRTLASRHPTDPRWPARSAELRSGFARPIH